jgi:hypothetical protein
MENVNNTRENYGSCFHSTIYISNNVDFVYRKAYKGDWGDWDEQLDTNDSNPFEQATITSSSISK